ncbi:MAG TPA: diadenylate cyclase CdaA [Thermoanaerobaculia bacterium]|nr:diadenylate cyclase CdaA [Thermoanaerobaculia bacterium]
MILERLNTLDFGWRDAVDILVVAFILYNILILIRGTRAMQMAFGLMAIGGAYFIARALDLLALEALAREILFYLPFAIIVLFQHEIRRALTSFGQSPLSPFLSHRATESPFEEILSASTELARRKVGALIVMERTQSLRMFTESGKTLDAYLSAELLLNIFTPNTPLHDGAVVVHHGRILAAGCFLPLSSNTDISKNYGTRHRAALGLSEETDALVIVISEENGSIAVTLDGVLYENLDPEALEDFLLVYVGPKGKERR